MTNFVFSNAMRSIGPGRYHRLRGCAKVRHLGVVCNAYLHLTTWFSESLGVVSQPTTTTRPEPVDLSEV
jgi:hypothetical protein